MREKGVADAYSNVTRSYIYCVVKKKKAERKGDSKEHIVHLSWV